ncbi:MAG: chemotaxis protein CheA [Nitrospirota bacterium]|nr:chemotaxis protein CheA [Nitrospirota bacterium]
MPDEMDEIISEFITEAEESLDRIEPLFVELEQRSDDKELLNNIFRSVHTIKGAAGFLGFQSMVDVAHSAESIMKKLREGEISLSSELMDVILKSVDMLRLLLNHLKAKDGIDEDVKPLVQKLTAALNASVSKAGAGLPEEPQKPAEHMNTASETGQTIAEADAVAEISGASLNAAEPVQPCEAVNVSESGGEDRQAAIDAEQKTAVPAQAAQNAVQKPKETAQNLRVDVERIDKVMDLAGEVVLVRNRLLNISNSFSQKYTGDNQTETLLETVSFLDRVTSDMQLAVMKIRMQPINKVLSKFHRLVRDISASVNKEVELEIYGESTEVDKTVIENIGDPLTHILRNSIDHSLEPAEERIAKGKPAKGKVVINTFQKGNQIVIEISDDGKGIDVDKIKRKAVEKELITEEDAIKLSDEAAIDLIFLPGFSTKEVATELSGRGVGMDVVKTNISLLSGYIEVSSVKGAGVTFRISIPLTLAIIQALMVEVSGTKYAIPLTPIEETLKVSTDSIKNVGGQDVIVIRDKICPLLELNDILVTGNGINSGSRPGHKYIVVISMGDRKFCVAVDRLLGQEEVVIKTIDGLDTAASYVLGATITGDGKVVFILDVNGISRNLVESVR